MNCMQNQLYKYILHQLQGFIKNSEGHQSALEHQL
jgi:hypothetical protein